MIVVLPIVYVGNTMPVFAAQPIKESVSMSKERSKNVPPSEHQYAYEDAAMPYLPETMSESAGQTQIETALQHHEMALMAIDGVVGVGVGRTPKGEDAILLYLRDASVKSRVPNHVGGYPVETTVTGEIDAYRHRGP
jgi:hypothetical protein